MTDRILSPLGPEISISSANNVGSGKLIRVFNTANAVGVLTFSYANNTAYANCSIGPYGSVYVKKGATDTLTLASGVAIAGGYGS